VICLKGRDPMVRPFRARWICRPAPAAPSSGCRAGRGRAVERAAGRRIWRGSTRNTFKPAILFPARREWPRVQKALGTGH